MPFVVRDLINEHRKPVTVQPEDSLQLALARMTEHEYSQLPVVDDDGRCLGMVTGDSILRALKTFGVTPDRLSVLDAKTKASMYREDDDLFELLDDLRDSFAVLIVDDENHVTGVVTGYDATEYFRRRTENMMFVEDIELMLKDLIQAAHTDASGGTDEAALEQSIRLSTRGASAYRRHFFTALHRYLDRCDLHEGAQKHRLNMTLAEEVFAETFEGEAPKPLDRLTFADYEALLLGKDHWPRYVSVFEPLTADAIRRMLDGVREIRNVLAHFRGDVTPEQRELLQFCVGWLREHPSVHLRQPIVDETAKEPASASLLPDSGSSGGPLTTTSTEDQELPDEVIESGGSRYAPLALFLMKQPSDRDRVSLTFSQVEDIIQGSLPPYARQHRAFWANDMVSHSQARQWLDVDWRVASVDLSNEVVAFSRIKERQKLYIDFFSALLAQLREIVQFAMRRVSPDGHHWITVTGVPDQGPKVASLGFSFAHNRRFRIELYIDTGERERNKRIFDHIYANRREIEDQLLPERDDSISNPLNINMGWERLDEKRACRVALYCAASVTDDAVERNLTISWAASMTPAFHRIMNRFVLDAIHMGA